MIFKKMNVDVIFLGFRPFSETSGWRLTHGVHEVEAVKHHTSRVQR